MADCPVNTPPVASEGAARELVERFLREVCDLANHYGIHSTVVTASTGTDEGQWGNTVIGGCRPHGLTFVARALAQIPRAEIDSFMRSFHDAIAARNFEESVVAAAKQRAAEVAQQTPEPPAFTEADLLNMPMPGGKPCKPS